MDISHTEPVRVTPSLRPTSLVSAGFADLSQRCRDLGVCDRVNPSIEDQLAAIEAARKSAHWKRVRKQKLRDRVNAIIISPIASA